MAKWKGGSKDEEHGGTSGADQLDGRGGNDRLWGNDGNDRIHGGDGNDSLQGNGGDDALYGDGGDDVAILTRGHDTFDGGTGFNFIDFYATAAVTVNLTSGKVRFYEENEDILVGVTTFKNVQGVYGSTGWDKITGDKHGNDLFSLDGNDVVRGGGGSDRINGGEGNDRLYGDGGNDQFILSAGMDRVDGGTGQDLIDLYYLAEGVTVDMDKGLIEFVTENNYGITTFTNIEWVNGSSHNDRIIGNAEDNILWGGEGNDTLKGGGGDDLFYASTGTDRIEGGAGLDRLHFWNASEGVIASLKTGTVTYHLGKAVGTLNFSGIEGLRGSSYGDRLTGDAGDNVLSGALGKDGLRGGAGQDGFVFSTEAARNNVDKIADFSVADDSFFFDTTAYAALTGTGATRHLGDFDYKALKAGQFYANNSGLAHDADDRLIYEKDTGMLWYDSDGTGKAAHVEVASIGTGLQLTDADFLLML